MSWMGLSMRVRILSVIAILLGLALIAVASWQNARGGLQPHRRAYGPREPAGFRLDRAV